MTELKNLYDKRHEFSANSVKPIERLYEKAKIFKDSANDVTHSWFYIVKSKRELVNLKIQSIIKLIKTIQKDL